MRSTIPESHILTLHDVDGERTIYLGNLVVYGSGKTLWDVFPDAPPAVGTREQRAIEWAKE